MTGENMEVKIPNQEEIDTSEKLDIKEGDMVRLTAEAIEELKKAGFFAEDEDEEEGVVRGASEDKLVVLFGRVARELDKKDVVKI